uniref:Uncharacterized protein LOC101515201 n=1 Tax=Cicer arietinum TaxID=3827 RepID=A0A1S2Z2S6_CICAR|nr:uncharacterized protein LOC101515201 [Cicer arietinum]
MARTKQFVRKNAYPCSPSSSSPSSDSFQRSPSPPPPPHISNDTSFSYYLSSSPETNPNNLPINPNPLSTVLPPLYTCPPPNIAQVPPHLRKPMIPKRRSMRVQSNIGTSKAKIEKPFYFIISDSETDDSPETPSPTTVKEKAQPKPITPSKSSFFSEPSQSTPPNQKRRLIKEIFSSLPKSSQPSTQSKKTTKTKTTMTIAQFISPSPQCSPVPNQECSPVRILLRSPQKEHSPHPKRSPAQPSHPREHSSPNQTLSPSTKSKHSPTTSSPTSNSYQSSRHTKKSKPDTLPLISPKNSKNFKDKWAQRPIGIGRVFIFDKLIIDGNDVQHHTDALGWTSFLQTYESYYPDIVRAFYCNAKNFSDKSLIISTIKGIEIKLTPDILASIIQLPTKGPSVFGNQWYSAMNLKETEVFSELFEEGSTCYLSTYLKPLPKVFNIMSQHTLIPCSGSHEYVSGNDALLIYHLFNFKRLNLPHVIIQHTIYAATKDYKKNIVPYGMILTKIFRHFRIPLTNEKSLIKISKFSTKTSPICAKHYLHNQPPLHHPSQPP